MLTTVFFTVLLLVSASLLVLGLYKAFGGFDALNDAVQEAAQKDLLSFFSGHRKLVQKFLEIAERKVSRVDEYGDEAKQELPEEIRRCLIKMGEREDVPEKTLRQWWEQDPEAHFGEAKLREPQGWVGDDPEYRFMHYSRMLKRAFLEGLDKVVDDENERDDEFERSFNEHREVVQKFLEIAERKVSRLDEYGDEAKHELPKEIRRCLIKIGEREDVPEKTLRQWWEQNDEFHFGQARSKRERTGSAFDDHEYRFMRYSKMLKQAFAEHHARVDHPTADLNSLSGVDFEGYVADKLKKAGFEDIRGTPTTGDQGVDLLARWEGRLVAIQVKRQMGTVGNGAVQEVTAGRQFYGADEAWVVTNSSFSASALALAQKTAVKLVDGAKLNQLGVTEPSENDVDEDVVSPKSQPVQAAEGNLDKTVLQCPNCGESYDPDDYGPSVEHIYCLRCKTEVQRSPA